ncbi:hypothetical protein TorRG33x02_012490 [Trema orientale]|uniref:Uncharacterized protein n=1 Tax=Trema orientale TaxID=63057 RepID=A0A2P5FZG5_TREOI|nr:hypothetical protein TorRG33x02_012490 [Trema orientale]
MSTSLPLKLGKNPSAFLVLAIMASYEDCSNHDSSKGGHSDPVVRARDCALLRILGFAYSAIDDNIYSAPIHLGFVFVVFVAANQDGPSSPPGRWWKKTSSPPCTSNPRSLTSASTWFNLGR